MNHSNTISFRKKPVWIFSFLTLLMLILAACQPASPAAAPTAAPTSTTAPVAAPTATTAPAATATTAAASSASEPVISVATDPKLGKILVDSKGMTLYMFKKDTADKSNCSAGCLKAWPPLLTTGSAKAGDGVDQSMIGTAAMPDGSKIVTYNHMPLYYFAKDMKPGDVTGQDVNQVWFVVAPDGKVVETAAEVPSTGNTTSSADVTINVATDPKLGKILVDSKGMTLYIFTKDTADKSNCTAGCLKAWPPLLTKGSAKAGDGVDQSMIGTADMPDGTKIVTYNHMPLYYWAGDTKAGDTTGQNVNSVWFVVGPDGKPVGMDSSSSSSSSGSSATAAGDVTINVATDAKLGKFLVDGKGMTLYMFKKDTADKSNCTAGCLKAWPPLLTMSSAKAGDGVDQSMIGTAAMPDGTKIVTYNHMPLYYWAKDMKPGDVTGQNVNQVWFVIGPDGKPIEK